MERRFFHLAVCGILLLAGCETGSNSSSDGGSVVNYAGTYSNGGNPMAFHHTGASVLSMSLTQQGDKLLATDNNGVNFRGSISGEGSDGLSPFSIAGKTTDGADVSIVGAFSRDSSRATMSGNWIEPTLESTFLGYSGDAPAPSSAAPTPTNSATSPTPPASEERSSPDYINAPASFSVATCTFKDDGGVGGWPITTLLRSVSVSGNLITMVYDNVSWPANGDVNGNCWFVYESGGSWLASTFDYLTPNQETKEAQPGASNRGIHSGDTVGVFVSTLARDDRRNGDERSNIFWFTWP